MSRRGGGGGGGGRRGSEPGGGDQQRSAPSPSFQRGGGRGGGRGRGRQGGDAHTAYVQPAGSSQPSTPSSVTSFPPLSSAGPSTRPVVQPPLEQRTMTKPAPVSAPVAAPALAQEMEKKLTLTPSSSKSLRPPARPGFGTIGQKVVVRANHFLVQIADTDLHHYDVTITPELTSKKVSRDVISQVISLYRESYLGGKRPAYDGRKSLYTAGPLPFESKQFVVNLGEKTTKAGSSTAPKKERQFKVTLKYAAKVDMHHLRQFLSGRQLDIPQDTIQILDTALRMSASVKGYVPVGRSFFSPELGEVRDLGQGVQCWKGYYQSLRPTQMGLSFNIDVSATSFFEPIFVSDFVAKYFNLRELSRPLSEHDRLKVKRALKGVRVKLTYLQYAKTSKITGISQKPVSQTTFPDDNKKNVLVSQYFLEKYRIRLNYPHLPAIQAGNDPNRPVYLPMELCKIVEGQRYSRKLNERQVSNLLKAACQRPDAREGSIKGVVCQNGYNKDAAVREFGISVKEDLALINARVLPPPMVNYHASSQEARVNPRLGAWNMINKKMVNGGRVDFWTCVNFSTSLRQDFSSEFCRQLIQMCSSKGMVFNPQPVIPIRSGPPSQIEKTLVDIHKEASVKLANPERHLQLLIIILPDLSGSYGKIKRICETELGIVSQCCQPKQASKLSNQYLENVSLKINVKVGGRNSVLNDAIQRRIPLLTDRPTIIFGADVTHPQPGEDSSPSIAAVVASMDWPEVTKYRGIVSAQAHRDEIIHDLYTSHHDAKRGLVHGGMIRELLIAFRRSTGHKPHRIIFYRDGVSEGQFSQVLLHEMDAIWKATSSLEEGYLPPVTFIVVQKRHHTRLFPADPRNRDRSGNILPGTVVDTNICHPSEHDFYLNSHAGIQGTSRPTHYHVLFDDNHFSADGLQMLTNSLCYTYARCTRSVSIVPPAYYAHLAAFRARYYIESETSDAGSSGGRSGSERNVEIQSLPVIKENVKDVMFYC